MKYTVCALAVIIMAGLIATTMTTAHTEEEQQSIPDWIKEVAGFWSQGLISDSEYAGTLEYLAKEGIIKIQTPPEEVSACDKRADNDMMQFAQIGLLVASQQDQTPAQLEYLASLYKETEAAYSEYLSTTTMEERDLCANDLSEEYVLPAAVQSIWVFEGGIKDSAAYNAVNPSGLIEAPAEPEGSESDSPASSSLFEIDIFLCGASEYGYVEIQGSIKNTSPNYYDTVEYILKLIDGGETIKLEKNRIYDMPSGYTEYIDGLVRYDGYYEQCGIQVVNVR